MMTSRIRMAKGIGFTLIELLVVMAIIGTLLTLVAPKYFGQTDHAKEVVLRHNLRSLREAIDQYWEDRGIGPKDLDALVDAHYIKEIPVDPITGKNSTWKVDAGEGEEGIRDVHSGAEGKARDGSAYAKW